MRINKIILCLFLFIGFYSWGDALKNLEDFTIKDVKKLPDIKVPDESQDLPMPNKEVKRALVKKSGGGVKNQPSKKIGENKIGILKSPLFIERTISAPAFISHVPLREHSLKFFRYSQDLWLGVEVQLYKSEYSKLKLASLLGDFVSYSPKMSLSVTKSLSGPDYFFNLAGDLDFMIKKDYGVGFKLVTSNNKVEKSVFSHGRIQSYLFYNIKSGFLEWDYLRLYVGWISNPVQFDFDKLQSQVKNVFGNYENAYFGIYYLYDVASDYSFSLETNMKNFMFRVGYR